MGMAGLAVEEFAKPFLAEKGSMHGLAHVKNVLKIAEEQRRKHGGDGDVILYAGYLHGIVRENGKDVKKFLESQRFDPKKAPHGRRKGRCCTTPTCWRAGTATSSLKR